MKTNNISFALSLGVWLAAGTYGCSGGSDPNAVSGSVGGASSSSHAGGQKGKGGSQSSSAGGSSATSSTAAGGKTGGGNVGGTSAETTQNGSDEKGGGPTKTASSNSKSAGGTSSSGGVLSAGGTSNTVGPKPAGGASTVIGTKSAAGGAGPGGGGRGPAATGGAAPAAGGSAASTTPPTSGSCTIAKKSGDVSEKIGPVGIVTFSVSGASSLDSAEIKFGLDTSYGLTAPVDVKTASADYRTLLLGMKVSKTYHYKIVGKSGGTTCESPDYTIDAGGCPTSIARPKVDPATSTIKDKLDGGFVVLEGYKASSDGNDYSYILDGDGDLVWCYRPSGFSDLTASRMSWDGKYMWLVHGNVPAGTAKMGRVSMDGLEFKDYSSSFTGLNHDAVVIPDDEAIGYIAYGSGGGNGCDDVKEFSPATGSSKTIINLSKAFSSGSCHGNAIKYDANDRTYVVSDDYHSGYVKVDRSGTIKWVLGGGSANHFDKTGSGGASTWTGEHNLHILGDDGNGYYRILFFNNGTSSAMSAGVNAVVREIGLDLKAMTTKEFWNYAPGISNPVMGDVQRLDNGNTLVAFSLAGIIHEVDKGGKLLQKLTWSGGSSGIGYVTKRKTLYGPSPR